jgi:hypothetical protein
MATVMEEDTVTVMEEEVVGVLLRKRIHTVMVMETL